MEFEPSSKDLQQLRAWLRKMPHVIQDYDDYILAAIVRQCKGSLQKTKTVIEKANALGMEYPEFFGSYDPLHPRLQEFLSVWLVFPLPKKTPDGCTVIFMSLNAKLNDASKSHFVEFSRYSMLTNYVHFWENKFGSGQFKYVMDAKNIGLEHVKDMTPTISKKLMKVQQASGTRISSLTVFNTPIYLEFFVNMFKSVVKAKIAERIFVYSSSDSLAEHIPQEMLPKEYGGCEESVYVLHDNWRGKVESYRQRFLEEEKQMRKRDSIRPRREKEEDDMTATFRQLQVD